MLLSRVFCIRNVLIFAPEVPLRRLSSISAKEQQFFKDVSQSWWREDGPLKALHSMNKIRVPWIKDTVLLDAKWNNSLANVNILDAGCGGGILCEPLARLGAIVTGIDLTAECVQAAEMHRDAVLPAGVADKLQYFNLSVLDLKGKMKFDAVVASEVVEHVENQDSFVGECLSLLNPGGHLFVTTLNRTWLSQVLGIYAAENVLNVVPKGTHDWDNFVKPEDLEFIVGNQGATVRMVYGLAYNPITNHWFWANNKSINYALHAIKD